VPGWAYNDWDPRRWIGLGKLMEFLVDRKRRQIRDEVNTSRTIKNMPQQVVEDILTNLAGKLRSEMPNTCLSGLRCRVHFSYDNDGLKVYAYCVSPPRKKDDNSPKPHLNPFGNLWEKGCYTKEQREAVTESANKFRQHVLDFNAITRMVSEWHDKLGKLPDIFIGPVKIDSPRTDAEFKWYAVSNLCESNALRTTYIALQKHRDFIQDIMVNLHDVCSLANQVDGAASRLKTGICRTEISGDSMISFNGSIFPVQLLRTEDAKNIVPISQLPVINGQLIGFTGFHGGGKTETSLAVAVNMWLFQSGIPPLGTGTWKQDVKDTLALVFIDNIKKHSTCQRLISKMTDVFRQIEKTKPGKAVVVLDELGTGTQEDAGTQLGIDVLTALSKKEISTLFTTQIQGLATHAKDSLGAKCFKFDSKHKISEGIGDGGMQALRKQMGLDKYLK
jgi:hypothetical protein